MRCRPDRWIIDKCSHGNMDKFASPNNRVEQRATQSAVRVVTRLITDDEKIVVAASKSQLFAFDARERLEGRACGSPAVRTMTIGCIKKFVTHGIPNSSTKTSSFKRTQSHWSNSGEAVVRILQAVSVPIPEVASVAPSSCTSSKTRPKLIGAELPGFTLRGFPDVSLGEARERADATRKAARPGVDVRAEQRREAAPRPWRQGPAPAPSRGRHRSFICGPPPGHDGEACNPTMACRS
jgi:hypothetical protein